jgi:hypothetical protein
MTTAEAIEAAARKALDDHVPTEAMTQFRPYTLLTLAESVASARVMGKAGDIENSKYYADADNYVIDVAYANTGWRAIYEVGPTTDPICWAD